MFLLAIIADVLIIGMGVYGMLYSFRYESNSTAGIQMATSMLTIGILAIYWLLAMEGVVPYIF